MIIRHLGSSNKGYVLGAGASRHGKGHGGCSINRWKVCEVSVDHEVSNRDELALDQVKAMAKHNVSLMDCVCFCTWFVVSKLLDPFKVGLHGGIDLVHEGDSGVVTTGTDEVVDASFEGDLVVVASLEGDKEVRKDGMIIIVFTGIQDGFLVLFTVVAMFPHSLKANLASIVGRNKEVGHGGVDVGLVVVDKSGASVGSYDDSFELSRSRVLDAVEKGDVYHGE